MRAHPDVAQRAFPGVGSSLLSRLGARVRRGVDLALLTRDARGVGRIDFAGQRSVYRIDDDWRLVIDGRSFAGQPDQWTELSFIDPSFSVEWTLAALARTTGSQAVQKREIKGERYTELVGITTPDPALWSDNGGRFAHLEWLDGPFEARCWLDPASRLRFGRLQAGFGPSSPASHAGFTGHQAAVIRLGGFGAAWTLDRFDPDDPRWDHEPGPAPSPSA